MEELAMSEPAIKEAWTATDRFMRDKALRLAYLSEEMKEQDLPRDAPKGVLRGAPRDMPKDAPKSKKGLPAVCCVPRCSPRRSRRSSICPRRRFLPSQGKKAPNARLCCARLKTHHKKDCNDIVLLTRSLQSFSDRYAAVYR